MFTTSKFITLCLLHLVTSCRRSPLFCYQYGPGMHSSYGRSTCLASNGGSCWKLASLLVHFSMQNNAFQTVNGRTLARGCVETVKTGCHYDHAYMTNCFCSTMLCNVGAMRTPSKVLISLSMIRILTRIVKHSP